VIVIVSGCSTIHLMCFMCFFFIGPGLSGSSSLEPY